MKKIQTILALFLLVFTISFSSCNEYHSLSSATKVSQLNGNPFYYNLAKSLLKNVGTYVVNQKLKSTVGKLNLLTPLSSLYSTVDQVVAFKSMLGSAYKIPTKKLDGTNFSNLGTMKDLLGFVAKNGTSFNFYN